MVDWTWNGAAWFTLRCQLLLVHPLYDFRRPWVWLLGGERPSERILWCVYRRLVNAFYFLS